MPMCSRPPLRTCESESPKPTPSKQEVPSWRTEVLSGSSEKVWSPLQEALLPMHSTAFKKPAGVTAHTSFKRANGTGVDWRLSGAQDLQFPAMCECSSNNASLDSSVLHKSMQRGKGYGISRLTPASGFQDKSTQVDLSEASIRSEIQSLQSRMEARMAAFESGIRRAILAGNQALQDQLAQMLELQTAKLTSRMFPASTEVAESDECASSARFCYSNSLYQHQTAADPFVPPPTQVQAPGSAFEQFARQPPCWPLGFGQQQPLAAEEEEESGHDADPDVQQSEALEAQPSAFFGSALKPRSRFSRVMQEEGPVFDMKAHEEQEAKYEALMIRLGIHKVQAEQDAVNFFTSAAMSDDEWRNPARVPNKGMTDAVDALTQHRILTKSGKQKSGALCWVPSGFSPTVEVLQDPACPDAGILGQTERGDHVLFGRIHLPGGQVEACAIKKLPYDETIPMLAADVHSELTALHMARELPHMVHGLAAFTSPEEGGLMYIITRHAAGLTLSAGTLLFEQKLLDRNATTKETQQARLTSAVTIARELLLGLKGMHEHKRGVCDMKLQNVMVSVDQECNFSNIINLDMGGSVCHSGPWDDRPRSLQFNQYFASPEIVFGEAGNDGDVHFDVCAHDLWAIGAIFHYVLTNKVWMEPKKPGLEWAELLQAHQNWAAECERAPKFEQRQNPIVSTLPDELSSEQQEALHACLDQMLQPDASKRCDVHQALDLIDALALHLPERSTTSDTSTPPASPPQTPAATVAATPATSADATADTTIPPATSPRASAVSPVTSPEAPAAAMLSLPGIPAPTSTLDRTSSHVKFAEDPAVHTEPPPAISAVKSTNNTRRTLSTITPSKPAGHMPYTPAAAPQVPAVDAYSASASSSELSLSDSEHPPAAYPDVTAVVRSPRPSISATASALTSDKLPPASSTKTAPIDMTPSPVTIPCIIRKPHPNNLPTSMGSSKPSAKADSFTEPEGLTEPASRPGSPMEGLLSPPTPASHLSSAEAAHNLPSSEYRTEPSEHVIPPPDFSPPQLSTNVMTVKPQSHGAPEASLPFKRPVVPRLRLSSSVTGLAPQPAETSEATTPASLNAVISQSATSAQAATAGNTAPGMDPQADKVDSAEGSSAATSSPGVGLKRRKGRKMTVMAPGGHKLVFTCPANQNASCKKAGQAQQHEEPVAAADSFASSSASRVVQLTASCGPHHVADPPPTRAAAVHGSDRQWASVASWFEEGLGLCALCAIAFIYRK